jgi:predicted lipoprotein with Yx(FWY)xxD motif
LEKRKKRKDRRQQIAREGKKEYEWKKQIKKEEQTTKVNENKKREIK